MSLKIVFPILFAASSASLLAWGGTKAHKNQEYNKKMWEYEKLREQFFSKNDSSITNLICKEKGDCKGYKEYFPKSNENNLWEKAYASFLFNFEINHYENIEELKNIKDAEEWKSYCYGEIKKDLNDEKTNFNPSGNTKGHESCVVKV